MFSTGDFVFMDGHAPDATYFGTRTSSRGERDTAEIPTAPREVVPGGHGSQRRGRFCATEEVPSRVVVRVGLRAGDFRVL